jgi:4-amino-4-deoxy-L-arabinose transferase-like glycosyltransferase
MPRSASFWKILSAILLGATVVFLLGARRVPLWDRDEPRYAQCTREMLQTGDWVVPRFLGAWRLEKPPFIHWCQLLAMEVEGDTPEAARFPSTVAVVFTALLMGVLVRRYTGARRALWTVFIFCTCGLAIASAKFCITDGMLLLFVAIGQACLALMYASEHGGKPAPFWAAPVFWISLGLAGLTKGPQPLGMHLVTLLTLLLLDVADGRRTSGRMSWRKNTLWWRQLKPLLGVPILVIVVAPWLVLIHRRAPGFILALFIKARMHLASSMEGHGKPPGYHAMLIFGTFYPWSVLLPTVIVLAWKNRRLPVTRFAIAATVGPWLMMEIVFTKLPFYVLPAFPGLSFLTADALVRSVRGQSRDLKRPIFMVAVAVWAIATLGLAAAPWLCLRISEADQLPIPGFIAFTIAGTIYAGLGFWRFYQRRIARAAIILGVGMAVMMAILYVAILPGLRFLHLSERLAGDLAQMGAYGADVPVAMIGYDEPSLAFYQGGGAREQEDDYLQSTPPAQWPRWIVIANHDWKNVPPELQRILIPRAREAGYNYSHTGIKETILILEKAPQ